MTYSRGRTPHDPLDSPGGSEDPRVTDLDQARRRREQRPDLERIPGSTGGWRYRPGGGPVWKLSKSAQQEEPELVQVLAWSPKVTERLVVIGDNGKSAGRYYVVQVGEDELTVSHADLTSGEAWGWFPDAVGTGAKIVRDALVSIVEAEAAKCPRTRVVDRTGRHDLPDGGSIYVHADGRTYPPRGGVRIVGIPEHLARAALPPASPAGAAEIRAALATVRNLGAPLLLGIGASARSLGYSLRPARTGLLLWGEHGSGKTTVATVGRMLSYPNACPTVPSATFADTVTTIERHVNREADVLVVIDDAALSSDSSEGEVREVNAKLERVFRAAHNGTSMRDRSSRDLTDRPGSYVRGIVAATLQQLPPTMQPSLYRRVVVMRIARGDVDVRRFYEQEAPALAPALHALGSRIVERLHAADAAELLATLDREAARLLGAHLDEELPGRSDLVHGMVLLAACSIAGLLLVADVAGCDREELAAPLVELLAEALAEQVRRMEDREAATEDLAEAVGEIVREALFAQRAHVREQHGAVNPEAVPGRTPQAQGLSERPDGAWIGRGPALYWLDNHGGIGVRTEDLYTLLRASRDPRVRGHGRRSLAADLFKAGALVPTRQKGKAASHVVRIGAGEGTPARLIVLRPGVVFPDDVRDTPRGGVTGVTGVTAEVSGLSAGPPLPEPTTGNRASTSAVTPVTPVTPPFEWVFRERPVGACSVCGNPCVTLGPDERPAHPLCWDKTPGPERRTVGGAFGDVTEWQAQWQTSREPGAGESGAGSGGNQDQGVSATAPAARVPGALDGAGLHLPDGQTIAVPDRSTGAAIARVAAGAGVRDVFLAAEVTRALDLEPARLQEQAEASPFLEPAGEWRASQDRLTGMLVYRHGDEREVTRLHVVSDAPESRLASLAGARDGAELLRLVLRFEELTGARWDGSASQTAVHLRRELARGNRGMSPGAYNPTELLPEALQHGPAAPSWYRPISAELAARYPRVLLMDQRANYLAVLGSSDLGAKTPQHVGPAPLAKLPKTGWARVRADNWPDPASFDPLGTMRRNADETGAFWADLHSLRYAAKAGMAVEVLEGWVFEHSRRFLLPLQTRLRDALSSLEQAGGLEREALRPLMKAMYTDFIGWLRSADYHQAGDVLWRPDWRDAIVGNAAVVTHRKLLRARGRVAAVQVDALGVLLERDDPEQAAGLLGGRLGEQLGDFKPERSWPSALHVLEPEAAGDPEQATSEIRRRVRDFKRRGGER